MQALSSSWIARASSLLLQASHVATPALCTSLAFTSRSYSSNQDDAQETIDFGAYRPLQVTSLDSTQPPSGYTNVPRQQKQQLVGQVFSSVASSYDVMNDLMSGGLHRLWKDRLVRELAPGAGQHHLDVAGGTGDVAFRVLRAIRLAEAAAPPSRPGGVTVVDINADMLAEGRRRASASGLDGPGLQWLEGNAEALPCEADSVDSYTIAFGIRNVTNRAAALGDAFRVLRPGGRFMCLEFSHVTVPVLREVYDAYSHHIIPQIGRMVAGDEASYRYLVESIRKFPDADTFADMVHAAGFSAVGYETLTGGIVALHSGYKL